MVMLPTEVTKQSIILQALQNVSFQSPWLGTEHNHA
jgi:hypothetical protein